MRYTLLLLTLIIFATISSIVGYAKAENVNLYSAQKEHLIRPVLDAFEKETGIKVNMITGDKAALVARLEHEGKNTPADVLLTVDIGNIYQAKVKGLLQTVDSQILKNQIPDYLRGPDSQWYGLTIRSRAIFYNKDKVSPDEIRTYEDLADKKWQDELLIRSSSNVYNQSLVASILAHHGEDKTKEWLKGVVANFARSPQGGDSDQLRALAAGEGSIAVANTYYYGRLIAGGKDVENNLVKEKVGIILPNQEGRGAHVNIRGGGVTKYAKNKENAVKLLEFLASNKSQAFFADNNFEYPAKSEVTVPNALKGFGEFKHDKINLESIGMHQSGAIELMDEVGWK
jgi:iron(III) transport system substrate-binding protein